LNDDLLQEPTIREMIYGVALEKHHDEILADAELVDAILQEGLKTATPADLRRMAKDDGERGYYEAANDLERLAGLLDWENNR
jgi:hypothetical protein